MRDRWAVILAGVLCAASARPQSADAPLNLYDVSLQDLMKVAVTGSRLSSTKETTASPIAVLDDEEIRHQGKTRTEDLLNSLPQLNSGLTLLGDGPSLTPLTGAATADLRGLGAFRTLVLIDGKRTAPGDPINPSADLNSIPSMLIKRVEVLTGGASAVYGSDAIAGVVNFILDTEFTGFKVQALGGIYRADNDRPDIQAVERDAHIVPPAGGVYDGATGDVSLVYGRALFAGDGHLTAYVDYRRTAAVSAAHRDFTACTLAETSTGYQCWLDGTTAGGQFVPNGGAALTLDTANGHAFRPLNASDLFNPNPYRGLQRPDTRYTAGVFASYRMSRRVEWYTEAQFMDDSSTAMNEPAGTTATDSALNIFNIHCNNPLLSASQVNDLCTSAGLGPNDTAQVGIGRRNVEAPGRTDLFRHQSYRWVVGLKGDINDPWSYDVSVTYGRVNKREEMSNDVSLTRLSNALDVVSVGGVPTCRSVVNGSDPRCVPYDIYSVGGVTPASLAYLNASASQSGFAQRSIATGQVIGDLGHYGLRSPWAADGVRIAAGAEYRLEQVRYIPDAVYATGDLLTAGDAHPTNGSFRVAEAFLEAKIPLLTERPFAKRVELNLSDRYAHYVPQGNVNAYGIGLDWLLSPPLRLRGSVSRAVRAPNAYELYSSQVVSQIAFTDPCAGVPTASAAQCALTGVTPAQYGNIPGQSAINVMGGGNPHLRPETADTFTAGVVITPIDRLKFSADYWRIKVKQYVGDLSGPFTVNTCLSSGDPFYCQLIHRDANGSLSTGTGLNAGWVVGTRYNTGSYGASGVDLDGHYLWSLPFADGKLGDLALSFMGSLALDNPINVTPGDTAFDCTGLFGPTCSGAGPTSPVPRWRHRLRLTWAGKYGVDVSLNWRHIGSIHSEFASSNSELSNPANVYGVDSRIDSVDYFDVDAGISLGEHVSVRLGIDNLTDRDPPLAGAAANPQLINGNLIADMYDVLGRYLFLGITAKY